ncbi:MAG: CARDB domain-containing protein [Candidatus Bathyarchaeia archaeon]
MLSHSAIVKLKAILVIDLIIVGAAAGVYFYLQNEGMIAGATRPAEFTLKNLIISPSEATAGNAVQISVNVTNIGDLQGNETVNFEINNAVKDTENVSLVAGSSQIVQFTDIETSPGNYSLKIGDLTGNFIIKPAPPESSKIVLSNLRVDPWEVWANQTVTLTATAQNPTTEADNLTVKVAVDGAVVQTEVIQLDAGKTQTVEFNVTAGVAEGQYNVTVNSLPGVFTVVETGYHTLMVNRSGGGPKPLPFTLDGQDYGTPYTALLPAGEHTISVPSPYDVGTGVVGFSYWSDGNTNPTRTFTLDKWTILVATYYVISGYASCPSLFIWNGTGYSYVTDVANSGWLGYIGSINQNGNIIFSGGNPWDYVKLDKNLLATQTINGNSYYEMALSQQWDELFYLDAASLVVVDHPVGTDAYTTMTNYLNKGSTEQIYTVNQTNILSPIAATNEKGQNVLPDILKQDGVYTPGSNGNQSPSWNNITLNQLTLDLGNLSSAQQIKLVITGIVDWGPYQSYNNWIDAFKAAAAQGLVPDGTPITPAPYMEIKAANGSWVRAPQDRQIPIPSDSNPRTFVVDLTGLFPKGISDYQIRITNFWNVTYDYVGIDTSTQQNITVQKISPIATLSQFCVTNSTSSGNFTRYGDVTALVQNADDMYVIGRQGDLVTLEFPTANLTAPAPGMERDYFLFVACWFKDPPGQWGYGFTYTVDPMPFMAMSGFPYPANESYPYDAAHLAYLKQYNTREIPVS